MIFLIVFIVILTLVAAMSVGVIFSNKPIKGTCGGLSALDLGECEICGGDTSKCDEYSDSEPGSDLSNKVEKFDPKA